MLGSQLKLCVNEPVHTVSLQRRNFLLCSDHLSSQSERLFFDNPQYWHFHQLFQHTVPCNSETVSQMKKTLVRYSVLT